MLCATVENEPRFRDLIGQWIAEWSVPEFPAFIGESERKKQSRKRRYQEEAKEAEEALREMGADTSEGGRVVKEGGGVGKGLDYLVQKIERGEWNEYHIYHHFCKCISFLQDGFQGEERGRVYMLCLTSSPHFRRKHSHSHLNLDTLAS